MKCKRTVIMIVFLLIVANSFAQSEILSRPDPGPVPGAVIDYIPSKTKDYVGSPSIAILPNGHYVASHDTFGKGPKASKGCFTSIFGSSDSGKTWRRLTELEGQWWSCRSVS